MNKRKWIPDDVGGGTIREDVQEAIRRELDYRQGEGDLSGSLKRWEKECLLAAINAAKPNLCLSVLHSEAAIKAGVDLPSLQALKAGRELSTGDVIFLCSGGHGFKMLEDMEMIEVKQGPYSGQGNDKEAFEGME